MNVIQSHAFDLFTKKNITGMRLPSVVGVLMRIEDKLHRMMSITKNGVNLVDEGLRDTLLDLHNYAAIMLLDSSSVYA